MLLTVGVALPLLYNRWMFRRGLEAIEHQWRLQQDREEAALLGQEGEAGGASKEHRDLSELRSLLPSGMQDSVTSEDAALWRSCRRPLQASRQDKIQVRMHNTPPRSGRRWLLPACRCSCV